MDNCFSYNSCVCEAITNYLHRLIQANRLDLFTVDGLSEFAQSMANNSNNLDEKDIYNLVSKVTSRDFKLDDFINHANNKLIDKYTDERERITNPEFYFEQAVVEISKKHFGLLIFKYIIINFAFYLYIR